MLEEDVAFSSIAQNEIGHARALYELAASELGTDADALAFDREPGEYRCAPLVELRLLDDWALTIARRYLYEEADRLRIGALMGSDDRGLAGLAARLHAEPRFAAAVDELWPYALGMLPEEQRPELARRVGRTGDRVDHLSRAHERGSHTPELADLWQEMTEVRRSVPGTQW
jgi:ring-1,2-phenylacetyl-CoA epoxidase subunit PaaC